MLNNPYRCVIDASGNYVDFVLLIEQSGGKSAPYAYELKLGEILIEAPIPANMIVPRWNDTDWEETATPEEIKASKPEPESQTQHQPSESERIQALETAMLAMMMGGLHNV